MNRWLVLFEDAGWPSLRPLTEAAPAPALAFGGSDLARRWRDRANARWLSIEARPAAMSLWRRAPRPDGAKPEGGDPVLVLNAAALPGAWLDRALEGPSPALWRSGDRIAGAILPYGRVAGALGSGAQFERRLLELELPAVQVEARILRWPWELVEGIEAALKEDLAALEPARLGELHPSAAILEPERVRIEAGARVDPQVVLDAREGPIRIGEGAVVKAQTVVIGPCAVGAGTELLGGLIARSAIGPGCRLAGEVDGTLWQGWGNKRHHGFVGHTIVGEWANLGALTTTSDLKNNYGPVRVRIEGRETDSGLHKVGSFLGAHVKTGIGTLLPTGCCVGTGASLFGGGRFAPKWVPPFCWWDGEASVEHRIESFLATARVVFSRRGMTLAAAEESALRALHAASAAERMRFEAESRRAIPAP